MSDVADKLREAKALIERGWCRSEYVCRGHVCAVGALQEAINGDPEDCSWSLTLSESERMLKSAIDYHSVIGWNDRQKSKRSVLAAFDKAIEFAEQSA